MIEGVVSAFRQMHVGVDYFLQSFLTRRLNPDKVVLPITGKSEKEN
jgi:hypothetical protein